jgi:predicted deacylase
MDSKGVAPEYAYNTSLGLYFSYPNMVYTYAKILDSYNTNGMLPASFSLKPWRFVSDPNGATFTVDQVTDAASWLKDYIEINHQLPDSVSIQGSNVTMASFLELLTTVTLQINNGDLKTPVDSITYGAAPNPRDDIHSGNMSKAEYLKIAGDVKSFMETKGVAPEYAYATSLGNYLGFYSLVCVYSNVLAAYDQNNILPSSVSVTQWTSFNVNLVGDAARWVKAYVDANHGLPDFVNIYGSQISMPTFLELLTSTVLSVDSGSDAPIDLVVCGPAPNPIDDFQSGTMAKAEYLKIAGDVKSFMDSHGVAPEYAYETSLGSHLGYGSLVYMYSQIMGSYNLNKVLPDLVSLKPWYLVINSFKIEVVVSGTGGYVTSNSVMDANIPKNEAINRIVAAAVYGTPMVTFGDGTGPRILIVAGVHGNEFPASIAALRLINYLNGKSIKGTVYIIPFAIPYSTSVTSRYWQGENPNGVANIPGTPTNQIINLAQKLNVKAVGDFHSTQPGGVPGQTAALYSLQPTPESSVIASYISGQTGSALIGADQAGVDYPGAVEDVCNLLGIPAVTCEVLSPHGTLAAGSIETSFNQMIAFLNYNNIL